MVPFGLLVTFFLVIPTLVVVIGSFLDADNRFTLANVRGLGQDVVVQAYARSVWISAVTAVLGAVLGALLAHAISTANPAGVLRRVVTAACGVLAQFGGVTLAFAFLATFGFTGFVTVWLQHTFGIDPYGAGGWLTDTPGLLLVYTYFQIPLMVDRLPAGARRAAPAVARGHREPRRLHLGVLAARRRPGAAAVVPRRRCCCSSRTPSRPTRPRRP